MEIDTSFVLSGSSSTDQDPSKSSKNEKTKNSMSRKLKYKQTTRKTSFGKKKRKRLFYGKFPKKQSTKTSSLTKTVSSLKKVSTNLNTTKTSQIFDMEHLQNTFNTAHVCFGGRLQFLTDALPSVGLFHQNVLRCTKCHKDTPQTNFPMIQPFTSTHQEPNQRLVLGAATTGIGYRAVKTVMSSLSLSIQSERSFLHHLHKHYDDLHQFAQKNFEEVVKKLKSRSTNQQDIMDITVSIDGTWKRRGHISNFGIVYVIDVKSGLCIDYEVMSLLCEKCIMQQKKLSKTKFRKWYEKHKPFCSKNYNGTSKSMEKYGTKRLYERSLEKGLRYTRMVCDGDASAYEAIKFYYVEQYQRQQMDTEPSTYHSQAAERADNDNDGVDYDESCSFDESSEVAGTTDDESDSSDESSEVAGTTDDESSEVAGTTDDEDSDQSQGDRISNKLMVVKEDCINHVSKRVMKYLLNLKKEKTRRTSTKNKTSTSYTPSIKESTTQQVLADNKKWVGGPGRMTNNMMKKLSDSYGLAIRQSSSLSYDKETTESLNIMQNACLAAFYHYMKTIDNNEEEQHKYCPKTNDSWCFYQQAKIFKDKSKNSKQKKRDVLDPIFREVLQPMIRKLTSRQLLRRCLGGLNQNSNESLNSIVWSILSKSKHHGFRSVRGSAALAALFFNSGTNILIDYFNDCGVSVSKTLLEHLVTKDKKRLVNSTNNIEQRQKRIRQKAFDRHNTETAKRDLTDYNPGGFNF